MGWEQPKKDFKKKNAENAMFENMYHSFKTHPNVVSYCKVLVGFSFLSLISGNSKTLVLDTDACNCKTSYTLLIEY